MEWTEEKLKRLTEINNLKKVPRYFAIKKTIEDFRDEPVEVEFYNKDGELNSFVRHKKQ